MEMEMEIFTNVHPAYFSDYDTITAEELDTHHLLVGFDNGVPIRLAVVDIDDSEGFDLTLTLVRFGDPGKGPITITIPDDVEVVDARSYFL